MTKKSTKAPAKKPAAAKAPKRGAAEATAGRGGKVAKTQLVEQVAEKSGLTKKQAAQGVDAAMDTIVEALRQGQSVGLPGLGTLSVRDTAARTGVRPGTSERIQIPAGKKVAFKVAQTLKGELKQRSPDYHVLLAD
ncbi:HU family DNA-binding protein [Deinococcus metallilatus]|nr:DNA-binding protein HU-beta [Deinococcus metallilatus]